jgi:hypothetical protein
LAKIDGRSQLAKRLKMLRADLIAHCGGAPSATQLALIGQAVTLQMRMDLMDNQVETFEMGTGGTQNRYLAWANAFQRLMKQLGQKATAKPTMSLAEHLAQRSGG